MTPSKKLNIFQRGLLQKAVTFFAYLGSIVASALLLDWTDKRLFAATLEEASKRGVITPEVSSTLQMFIEGRDGTIIFAIIVVGISCVTICWLLMRWAAKRNWSWPVSLAKAIEFRAAMAQLGIIDPIERIDFVRKHKLPVFIALSPLIGKEQINVRAQYYAFAHDHSFGNNDLFERHIGKQTLCLNAEDFEQLLREGKTRSSLAESVALVNKNEEIKNLRISLASLIQEHADTTDERDILRGKVKMQPAHEETRVDRLRVERLIWAAFTPVLDRLMRDAPAGKQYTTPEIEAAFKAEWEQSSDLRKHMLFLTGNEAVVPSGAVFNVVKEELKAVGKLSPGGRPKKNP